MDIEKIIFGLLIGGVALLVCLINDKSKDKETLKDERENQPKTKAEWGWTIVVSAVLVLVVTVLVPEYPNLLWQIPVGLLGLFGVWVFWACRAAVWMYVRHYLFSGEKPMYISKDADSGEMKTKCMKCGCQVAVVQSEVDKQKYACSACGYELEWTMIQS